MAARTIDAMFVAFVASGLALANACGRVSARNEEPPSPDGGTEAGSGGVFMGSGGTVASAGGGTTFTCANGVLDEGEQCDGVALRERTCAEVGLGEGALGCDPMTCRYDTSGCQRDGPPEPICEDLSGTLPFGCDGSVCGCYPLLDEECDVECWKEIACVRRLCAEDPDDPACAEECTSRTSLDRAVLLECLRSAPECDVGRCGNGRRDGDEECDGEDVPGATCQTIGFSGGEVGCSEACTFDYSFCRDGSCGNGVIEENEGCDGDQMRPGLTCEAMEFSGGTLRCDPACVPDPSGCHRCGNGHASGDEECDGDDFKGLTCRRFGFSGGSLRCAGCKIDRSGCSVCGNGSIDQGESCDGEDLAGETCDSLGLPDGTLACSARSCRFDTTGCGASAEPACGNGVAEEGEDCDGNDLVGLDCASLGFAEGTLSCRAGTCRFDTSDCSERPRETCAECRERLCQFPFDECAGNPRCSDALSCLEACSTGASSSDFLAACFQDCLTDDFDGMVPPNETQTLVLVMNLWGCLVGNCQAGCF